MSKLEIPINEPFAWSNGLWLKAITPATIVFPGTLVAENETIGAILETFDDETQIGFQQDSDGTKGFARIFIQLQPGMSLKLHRSTQAIVVNSTNPALFEVLSPPGTQ